MKKSIRNFLKQNKRAQGLVEWIMILALILVVVVGMLRTIGNSANSKASTINSFLG